MCPVCSIVVSAPNRRGTEAYMATVPPGIGPGDQFPVLVNNQQMMVTCPPGVGPGMQVGDAGRPKQGFPWRKVKRRG